jgi:hypothetical protein
VSTTADDAWLVTAEREIATLRTRSDELSATGDFGDHPEIWNRIFQLDDEIARTPVSTLAGAAVKLRRLADPKIGLEAGQGEDDPEVLAVVERMITASVAQRVPVELPPPPAGDSEIIMLFREWVAADRAALAVWKRADSEIGLTAEERAESEAAYEVPGEISLKIFAAAGPADLAIKTYLVLPDYEWRMLTSNRSWAVDLLKDLVRFVPELAPLVAGALAHEPATAVEKGDPA